MSRPVQRRRTAKARILEAADDLFYNEGIHAVGIDRVIAQAGVAKGSLYYSFTGKDDLIRAYLAHRHGTWAERISAGIAAHTDPRDRIVAVYDVLATLFAQPGYHGCAFVNATAEAAPDSVEARAATTFRAWLHDLFLDLATGTDAADPNRLADTLVLLYDGAVATSHMDKTPDAARTARQTAELVLDHACTQPGQRTATSTRTRR
ncbi:MAG TPA: TetR/AcrR family transcriptional regulator [Mycobacteriales bacterium]|nr:TetR/AcrR family transcriptional regulator [Mycobacteriales bacterium]